MNSRIKPIKLKIIAVIFIDVALFFLLVLVGYAFFSIPASAAYVDCTETTAPSQTFTPEPSATNTLEPSPTIIIEPSSTYTLEPSPTNTVEPSATNTLESSPTNTVEPSVTNTIEPSPTNTIEPSATNTLEPSQTSTIKPSATSSHFSPTPTLTPKPSGTPTRIPTNTQTSTIEPSRTPSPTTTPTLKTTLSKEGSSCPSCYIVKDFREIIVSGLYTADLLNTEDISSTFKVSITLFDVYKGMVVGETIDMVDTQPANEVMQVKTPLWCIVPVTGEVYWIHSVVSAQKTTGEIWFVVDEWVRIKLTDDVMKVP